ncbi:large subunit ribosomal protein L25 [Rhodobium orientis]|uniref:Large ribosomal subunit protein bL25 n=1 Tax=Rhodobium orientis TaxID=34017 RepID=A0A327JVD6_9HYPH|nr:50S ribosomal protein L25/general stress protein Ctc [Rhodobium orientis]MBB4301189.1 large subunit ribosomal protein L25 [Rhodobium orientis]MBK5951218.1 50S ribosomal protein L25/general stress protein Ctc [Rhodobium orientis]RAI30041.1 50S ribosomal protein L25/general stress protein Ctc [Rhodobium orientis]
MSESYEIAATVRERVGKGAARALRRENKIPAVIYGDKKSPEPIAVDLKDMTMRLHGGAFMTTVATVNVDGKKSRVIPRDFQLHPVRDELLHIDFLRITKGAKLTVEVPVTFINEESSKGLKRGGVLNVVRYTVELDCPVDAIPDNLELDLAGLDLGDSIHISAVTLPEGVTPAITDRDFTIATIAAPAGLQEEEEEEAEAAEAEAEAEGEGEGGEDGSEKSEDGSEQ